MTHSPEQIPGWEVRCWTISGAFQKFPFDNFSDAQRCFAKCEADEATVVRASITQNEPHTILARFDREA